MTINQYNNATHYRKLVNAPTASDKQQTNKQTSVNFVELHIEIV